MTRFYRHRDLVNRQGLGGFGGGSLHTPTTSNPSPTGDTGTPDDSNTDTPPQDSNPTTTPTPPNQATGGDTKTTAASGPANTDKPGQPGKDNASTTTTSDPGLLNIPGLLTGTTTSTTLSTTTTSTSTTSTSTSITTSSTSSIASIPTNTSLSHTSTTRTITSGAGASADTSSPSPSVTPNAAVNTGTLVGIIGGSIVGVAILACIIAFFIRRWRRKQEEEEAFSASQFRRSGIMLDEPYEGSGNDSPFNPRPPTMIERHMARSPGLPPPPATYSPAPYPQGNPQSFAYHQQSWTPGEFMPSPISPNPEHDAHSPAPFFNRQPSPPAHFEPYHDNPHGHYVEMDRAAATPAPVAQPATQKRPETVYDPEDAYGGM